jgi:hypothetical protein
MLLFLIYHYYLLLDMYALRIYCIFVGYETCHESSSCSCYLDVMHSIYELLKLYFPSVRKIGRSFWATAPAYHAVCSSQLVCHTHPLSLKPLVFAGLAYSHCLEILRIKHWKCAAHRHETLSTRPVCSSLPNRHRLLISGTCQWAALYSNSHIKRLTQNSNGWLTCSSRPPHCP